MEGIREPVPRPLYLVLRRAVLDHASQERRRVHPPRVHVGWPGGHEQVFAVGPHDVLDQTLRCDVLAALVRGARLRAPRAGAVPMLWLTRSGPLEVGDADLAWLAAARAATAEAGLALTFVAVTRHGWIDPRTGVHREWRRIRAR